MIQVYGLDRQRTAYIENAFSIQEDEPINDVAEMQFSLPIEDKKTAFCHPLHYARYDDGQLYRIVRPTKKRSDVGTVSYLCEHVIATLADSVMRGTHIVGNLGVYTRDVINYVLSKQKVQNWVLDECDFARQFEYSWENETCLNALWSIPNRFTEPYIWKFNTSVYPWRISLKRIDPSIDPQYFIRGGKNLLTSTDERNSQGIVTRLYALGYGEGVNQLTIASVNNGVEYLQSPQSVIDEYGIIERIWADRRFEDPQSLKERCAALLAELQEPRRSCTVDVADVYQTTHDDHDKIENGRIVQLVDEEPSESIKTYVTSIRRNHDEDSVQITIANKPTDIASSLADLAERQRIEAVYAQGATQLYAQSIQANATAEKGAVLNFYIPSEMRIVNAVKAKISLSRFRSYSKTTEGGGKSTQTSSNGGKSTQTSSSGGKSTQSSSNGGGTQTSTATGGGATRTTDDGGYKLQTSGSSTKKTTNIDFGDTNVSTTNGVWQAYSQAYGYTGSAGGHGHAGSGYTGGMSKNVSHSHTVDGKKTSETSTGHQHSMGSVDSVAGHTHPIGSHYHQFPKNSINHTHDIDHQHNVEIPNHNHQFSVPEHQHTFEVQKHTHTVEIPAHTHTVEVPAHTHNITQGIFEFGSPAGADIYVNGVRKASMGTTAELDITQYLVGENNQIPRGSWMRVEIRPNDLAYVSVDMFVQGFVQSRGGSTY